MQGKNLRILLFLCFISQYLKYPIASVAPQCYILKSVLLCCHLLHIVHRLISNVVLVCTGEIWKGSLEHFIFCLITTRIRERIVYLQPVTATQNGSYTFYIECCALWFSFVNTLFCFNKQSV